MFFSPATGPSSIPSSESDEVPSVIPQTDYNVIPQTDYNVIPRPPIAAPPQYQEEPKHSTLAINDGVQTVAIKGTPRNILDHVTVSARKGEFIGVVGGSGSGKSTFLKAIAGINELTSGQILLEGRPATRAQLLGDKRIADMPQDIVIHDTLTANAALNYIAELKGLGHTSCERRELVDEALKRTDMLEFANTTIKRLSGGQQKRVALSAELLGEPEIILLDEATSGLDPSTEAEMMRLFKTLADDGKTVFCITHFPKHLFLCDRL